MNPTRHHQPDAEALRQATDRPQGPFARGRSPERQCSAQHEGLPESASCRHGQSGLSLVEIMVALVLLSFGLMGMLGLKMAGLKHTGQANARAAASVHATDILDRMRANPVRAAAGAYTLGLADAAPATPDNVAQVDLVQWRRGIAANLPGGTGGVSAVGADGSVRVVLQWVERRDAPPKSQDQAVQKPESETETLSFTFDARL